MDITKLSKECLVKLIEEIKPLINHGISIFHSLTDCFPYSDSRNNERSHPKSNDNSKSSQWTGWKASQWKYFDYLSITMMNNMCRWCRSKETETKQSIWYVSLSTTTHRSACIPLCSSSPVYSRSSTMAQSIKDLQINRSPKTPSTTITLNESFSKL